MNFLTGIHATASALTAEQTRLEIVAQNIANAYTTKGADGGPYKRKYVTFESVLGGMNNHERGVRVASIQPDPGKGEMIYNPGHPHANAEGILELPNVKLPIEMVDLMSASRAYEANLSVARNSRTLAAKALAIGK